MEAHKRQRVEAELQQLCEASQYQQAVTLALRSYGPEIRKLMMAVLRQEDRVDDAFGIFGESLLKSLPRFRWESSFRTWAYRVARHICAQYFRALQDHEKLAGEEALDKQPQPERTVTQPWLRTEFKNRFRALHDRLSPHERRILTLRIEGRLSWNEVARAMAGHELSPEELRQRVAVLRQQFQRLKAHLRELAHEESLIHSDSA
jgi:RNA polymerase sigma-70 factor (ECF subfamily)